MLCVEKNIFISLTGKNMHIPTRISDEYAGGRFLPVDEPFKERVQARTEKWRNQILAKYAPTDLFDSMELDGTRIIHQREDYPYDFWLSIQTPNYVWTVEQRGQKHKPCLLITETPTVWDADSKDMMLMFNREFTIYDAEGSQGTVIRTMKNGIQLAEFLMDDNRTFAVHSYAYALGESTVPVPEVLGEPVAIAVSDGSVERWFVRRGKDSYPKLELIDGLGNAALKIDGLSFRERFWQFFGDGNFGPRKSLWMEQIDKSLPKEVVLYLATRAVRSS